MSFEFDLDQATAALPTLRERVFFLALMLDSMIGSATPGDHRGSETLRLMMNHAHEMATPRARNLSVTTMRNGIIDLRSQIIRQYYRG